MSRVLVLIATIPVRRRSCERVLVELTRQSRRPDGVILVLDGYGDTPAPACTLPVIAEYRTTKPLGPGGRWRAVIDLPPDDIIVNLDDDVMLVEAPKCIEGLAAAVETGGGASAAMGRDFDCKPAPPGDYSRGNLAHAAGCGLTARVKDLLGVQERAAEVQAATGLDTLGPLGDDDALVSAHLWKNGVRILHATTGNIYAAPGTQASSQSEAGKRFGNDPYAQKKALRKLYGWPGPVQ